MRLTREEVLEKIRLLEQERIKNFDKIDQLDWDNEDMEKQIEELNVSLRELNHENT